MENSSLDQRIFLIIDSPCLETNEKSVGGLEMRKIERAIISVTDKSGVVDFARSLSKFGVQILSTGGTAKVLREGGLSVTDISRYTGFPEMLDGRVKTLHPKVHGGLLGMRDNPEHVKKMKEHDIQNIDMVVVNLYQFEKTVARKGVTLEEAVEHIDIGGPTMIRSAAKNYKDVTVIVDPADYEPVLKEMEELGGWTSLRTRFRLATKVFRLTHEYDRAISRYLEKVEIEGAAFRG
jgi:phosphoribosylaminoimidazolecarboxamide formyltransferase/IMP cyclohydrolase